MRPARAACVRGNDHAKTAVGREGERALLFDAKLRSKNVHGQVLERQEVVDFREG
jgi:hypothetical protein